MADRLIERLRSAEAARERLERRGEPWKERREGPWSHWKWLCEESKWSRGLPWLMLFVALALQVPWPLREAEVGARESWP